MMRWLAVLLILGLVSGLLGFTHIAGNSIGLARTLCAAYWGLAVLTLTVGVLRR